MGAAALGAGSGALGGAGTGFMIGGPVGAAIGGIGGGVLGALGGMGGDGGSAQLQSKIMANQMADQEALLRSRMGTQGVVFNNNLALTQELLNANAAQLGLESNVAPILPTFNANQVSQEAAQLGMANLARSRQEEELTNPEAAKIRREQGKAIEDVTSSAFDKQWMNELMKRGVAKGIETGISPTTSSIGANAFFNQSAEQRRQRELENAQIQQAYLQANPAPSGGINPEVLAQLNQNTVANNASQLNSWIQGLMAGGQNLITNTGNMEAKVNQSIMDAGNQNYANLAGDINTQSQNDLNYAQMLYQNAANQQKSNNQSIGAILQGLGQFAGNVQNSGGFGNVLAGLGVNTPSYSKNFGSDFMNSAGGYENKASAAKAGIYNPTFYGNLGENSAWYAGS